MLSLFDVLPRISELLGSGAQFVNVTFGDSGARGDHSLLTHAWAGLRSKSRKLVKLSRLSMGRGKAYATKIVLRFT